MHILLEATEDLVSQTQYGFMPNHSTSHAIYILRRSQDYTEIKGAQLSIAFLDWEKAFNKIQHGKLIIALQRLGFSDQYTDVIADCYSQPQLFRYQNSVLGTPTRLSIITLSFCFGYDLH